MSRSYREAMKFYTDNATNDIFEDNLVVHMMETVAPSIWMSITFEDEVAEILERTAANIAKKQANILNKLKWSDQEEPRRLSIYRMRLGAAFLLDHLWGKTTSVASHEKSFGEFLKYNANADSAHEIFELAKRFGEFALPPYRKLWLDIPMEGEDAGTYSVLVEQNPTEFLQAQMMPSTHGLTGKGGFRARIKEALDIENLKFRPRYRCLVFVNGTPLNYCINYVPKYNDFVLPLKFNSGKPVNEDQIALCHHIGLKVRTAFMLINARNSPLDSIKDPELEKIKAAPASEIADFEKKLVGRNKRHNMRLKRGILRFNLSRLLKRYPNIHPSEIKKFIQRQMVVGHFKLRKTGLWWWSAHMRGELMAGQTDDDIVSIARERGRAIRATRPGLLVLPDGKALPGAEP